MLERAAIAGLGLVVMALPATGQVGQFVAGGTFGSAAVQAAGDVDDDGHGDVIVRLAQVWEVRSGATGTAFAFLTRSIAGVASYYVALRGDLDADGHDDLAFAAGGGVTQFVSGADGSVLFQHAGTIAARGIAADHDGDGHDDVMVVEGIATGSSTGTAHYHVLSGRNGSTIATSSFAYTATSYGHATWCGDVDGDGHVDMLRTTTSFANPWTVVLLGPGFTTVPAAYGGFVVEPAGDTNGDGRDELLVGPDLVDPTTATVVWPMWPAIPMPYTFSLDVDGDGAVDVLDGAQHVFSGRLQAAWPALPGAAVSAGDGDGDGRDELAIAGTSYELQGVPATSFVRDRGAAGSTSTGSRPRIRHRLRARLGESMRVDLLGAGGPQLVFLAIGTALDVDLGPFGAADNRAYVDPWAAPSQFADASGFARFVLQVPTQPALVGANLSLQWAVVDPAANALGVVTSNALDCVVGH